MLTQLPNINSRLELEVGDIVCNHNTLSFIDANDNYRVYYLGALRISKVVAINNDATPPMVAVQYIEDRMGITFSCENSRRQLSALKDIENKKHIIAKAKKGLGLKELLLSNLSIKDIILFPLLISLICSISFDFLANPFLLVLCIYLALAMFYIAFLKYYKLCEIHEAEYKLYEYLEEFQKQKIGFKSEI